MAEQVLIQCMQAYNAQQESNSQLSNRLNQQVQELSLRDEQLHTKYQMALEDNEELLRQMQVQLQQLQYLQAGPSRQQYRELEQRSLLLQQQLAERTSELEDLRQENERLIQHQNVKQKLQYHVKIKQENNDLRESLRVLKEEHSAMQAKLREHGLISVS